MRSLGQSRSNHLETRLQDHYELAGFRALQDLWWVLGCRAMFLFLGAVSCSRGSIGTRACFIGRASVELHEAW